MAVRFSLPRYSVVSIQTTLVAILYFRLISASLDPVITITPKNLKLKNENDTFGRSVFVRCSTGINNVGELSSIKSLRIMHKGEEEEGDGTTAVEATDTQKTAEVKNKFTQYGNKYSTTGTLGSSQVESVITFTIKRADCADAGNYKCAMTYTAKDSNKQVEGFTDGYIYVSPYGFEVTSKHIKNPEKKTISAGDELLLSCTAVVGTVKNDELFSKAKLEWVYRSRESAVENIYIGLDPEQREAMIYGDEEKVRCSNRQTVQLKLTVDKVRDSLRDYFCVAARYMDGGQVSYVGGGSNTNVSIPSFEKARKQAIGIGGFVGIGLGALAVLSGLVFGVIWCIRRNKKKQLRQVEIEKRKSIIDERRKSIASVVESRKTISEAPTEDDSSAAEESSATEETSPPPPPPPPPEDPIAGSLDMQVTS